MAVGFVAGHPGGGDAGVQRGGDHLSGQAKLGRELPLVGYTGRVAAPGTGGPGVLGQVEPPVDQRPPPHGGQRKEHADLAVLDASCGAGVLPLRPRRGPALLHEAGLIDDQNTAVGAEVADGVGAQVVTDGIGVPAGVAQQALHRPGPGVTGLFGQLPAVLALDIRQQPEQTGAGGGSRLNSAELSRNPGHGLVDHRPPLGRVYAMACGHRTIFRSPHNPR